MITRISYYNQLVSLEYFHIFNQLTQIRLIFTDLGASNKMTGPYLYNFI